VRRLHENECFFAFFHSHVCVCVCACSPPSRAWVSLRQEWSSSAVSMDMLVTPGVFYGVPNYGDNSSMNAGCGDIPARARSLPLLLLLPLLLCLFSSSQLTLVLVHEQRPTASATATPSLE
jgi:hypothetical protein